MDDSDFITFDACYARHDRFARALVFALSLMSSRSLGNMISKATRYLHNDASFILRTSLIPTTQ